MKMIFGFVLGAATNTYLWNQGVFDRYKPKIVIEDKEKKTTK